MIRCSLFARISHRPASSASSSSSSQCCRQYASSSTQGWNTVIGLELHCQLKSDQKLFSDASTRFDDAPNSNVALFDMALPGSLPQLNPKPLKLALLAALALNCQTNLSSRFDRKHYFYHDLPPGYQITQKYQPIAQDGAVSVKREDGSHVDVGVEQLQLEQDTAKTTLDPIAEEVLVDLNRAGVPLIEIISKPHMRSASEAGQYVNKVRDMLRCVGASDGDMENGSLRIDVNVSVHPHGSEVLGTRCEIKNLNSVRFMMQAIEYEAQRQINLLTADPPGLVDQETRRYDPLTRQTYLLRSKADAPDYRYMPDPELPPLVLPQEYIDHLRTNLPELPDAIYSRLLTDYSIPQDAAERLCKVESAHVFAPAVKFFEAATAEGHHRATANWIAHDLMGLLTKHELTFDTPIISPADLRALVSATADGRITATQAKGLLAEAVAVQGATSLQDLVKERSAASSPQALDLDRLVDKLLERHSKEAQRLRQGQQKLLGFFVGQAMRETQGRANAKALTPLLKQKVGL